MADMDDNVIARNHIRAQWKHEELKRGESLVHDSQKREAQLIVDQFTSGRSLVTFIASPQWGKTGVSLYVAYLLSTMANDDEMINPEAVYIVTGMSDKEWIAQTRSRLLPMWRDKVFHRNDVHKVLSSVVDDKRRNMFIVIDECHFGSERDQTIHQVLDKAGILDLELMRTRNIKIMCISATPGSLALDAVAWGANAHATIVAQPNPAYMGFQQIIDEGRIHPRFDINSTQEIEDALRFIERRWRTPKYHILRLYESKLTRFQQVILEHGYQHHMHNCKTRISDVDNMLDVAPASHTFIFIKGFWRAAKTLNDTHIGLCYESSDDDTVIAQGIPGRLLGYGRQTGILAPVLFCKVTCIENYLHWIVVGNGDYSRCVSYNSTSLRIVNGMVRSKVETTVLPSLIKNMDTPKSRAKQRNPANVGNVGTSTQSFYETKETEKEDEKEKKKEEKEKKKEEKKKEKEKEKEKVKEKVKKVKEKKVKAEESESEGGGDLGRSKCIEEVRGNIPLNAQAVTYFELHTLESLESRFNIKVSRPKDDESFAPYIRKAFDTLNKHLIQSAKVSVNVSCTLAAARSLSNYVNYFSDDFKWAKGTFNIVKLRNDEFFRVIEKRTEVLDALQPGDLFVAHNYKQERFLYRR
jgi:hypothetical protein